MTGQIVNLNQVRKARAKAADAATAEVNRVRFGRTRTERKADAATARRRAALLDGAKLDR